jgi:hypothetical protein
VLVISLGISTYRVLTARPGEGWRVFGQEAGAQALGWGGAVLAGAACVGFGIATGGVGLLLCGMAGGLLGGLAGSALGGRAGDALSQPGSEDDPFGLLAPGEAGPGPVPVGDGGRAVLVSPVTGEPLLVPLLPEPQLLDY